MEVGLPINKFDNLNVFITGASSGIGFAVAKSYLKMGSNVFCVDIRKNNNKEFNSNERMNFYSCDISNYSNMKNIINNIYKKINNIDVLINCAGIIDFKSIEDSSYEFWKKIIDVNLTGAFITCKLIVPIMKKNKWGRIINICSSHGQVASINKSAYVASKQERLSH